MNERIKELAKQPAQQEPVAGGKLQVTLQDTPTEIELAQYKRMFSAACADLAEINEALGLDPNDGGAEPILFAIKELKGRSQEPVAWMYVNTDGECEQIEYGEPFDGPDVTPLYTSPQPCPTCEALARSVMLDQTSHDALRKPLTDDEIWEIAERSEDNRFLFARAIEAAHGIKAQQPPVTQRPWVGLTKQEVDSWELPDCPTVFEFVQFIEDKLKEKNT